jgi:hypothetical protein
MTTQMVGKAFAVESIELNVPLKVGFDYIANTMKLPEAVGSGQVACAATGNLSQKARLSGLVKGLVCPQDCEQFFFREFR